MTQEYQLYALAMNVLGAILIGTTMAHIIFLKLKSNKRRIARGIAFAILLLPFLATKLIFKMVTH